MIFHRENRICYFLPLAQVIELELPSNLPGSITNLVITRKIHVIDSWMKVEMMHHPKTDIGKIMYSLSGFSISFYTAGCL